jgi:copper resistance protein C
VKPPEDWNRSNENGVETMKTVKRIADLIAGSAALVLFVALASHAYAHAQLIKAEPAQRATVTDPPKQVGLWFDEDVEGDYARLSVMDSSGKPVTETKPVIAADDPKFLELALPALGPGKYTVKYRVLSVDGHVVEDSYDFTVQEKAPEK